MLSFIRLHTMNALLSFFITLRKQKKSWLSTWIILLGLFFYIFHAAVTTTSNSAVIFYLFILLFCLHPIPEIILHSKNKKLFLCSLFISFIIYALLARFINGIELWGDEIEDIRMSNLPFREILGTVKKTYFAAPPLGFWGLWLWNHLKGITEIANYELFYRLPNMVVHSLGAGIFGALIAKFAENNTPHFSSYKKIIYFSTAYFIYFFNPILFFYSIEVRFYAIAILGSLIGLYYFLLSKEFQRRHIFLLYFFLLNSITQFLIFIPLWLKIFLTNKKDRFFIILASVATGILGYLVLNTITPPKSTAFQESGILVTKALSLFISLQTTTPIQIAFFLLIITFLLWKKDKNAILLVSIAVFFLATTSVSALIQSYYDFHVRHLSYAIPWLLLVIIIPLVYLSKRKLILYITFLYLLFVIPWSQQIISRLYTQNTFSKSLLGVKYLTSEAKRTNGSIILLPNNNPWFEENYYEFNKRTFIWYTTLYKVPFYTSSDVNYGCNQFKVQKNSYIIDFTSDISCSEHIPQQRIHGTMFKINKEKSPLDY